MPECPLILASLASDVSDTKHFLKAQLHNMVAVTSILPISSTLVSKPQQGSDPQLKIQYLQMLVSISYSYLKVQHLTSTLKHSKIQTCFIVSIKTYPYPGSLGHLPRILPRE